MKQDQENSVLFDQQVNFLKKIVFFQDFDDHELKQLLAVSRWLKVPADTLIIKENTFEKIFYILVKGSVSVFITVDHGQTIELTQLTTGDTFGEMALVSETRRTAGVKTTQESFILMVEPDILNQASVFLQLKFYQRFCEILVTRLVAANKKMGDLSSQSSLASPANRESQIRQTNKSLPKPDLSQTITNYPPPQRQKKLAGKSKSIGNIRKLTPIPKLMAVARAKTKEKIQSQIDLAINPAIATRLSSFLVGNCEDTRKFAELISCDPILAAKVLQHANSSFYRRTTTVNTVPHAMVTMGIKNLQEVIARETLKVFQDNKIFGGYNQLCDGFWQHSVAVGRIAELLRDAIRINISEDVYLAGLFHDLGKLSLDRLQPQFYPQLLLPDFSQNNICEMEQKHIGIDHTMAGFWLGEKIGLPQAYLDVIHLHHTPEKAKDNPLLVSLIQLADLFAKEKGAIMGRLAAQSPNIAGAFGWIVLQEQHHPFLDVNVDNFIRSFQVELNRVWGDICSLPTG